MLAHPLQTKSIGQSAKHLPIQESFVQYGSFVSNDLNLIRIVLMQPNPGTPQANSISKMIILSVI